MNRFIQTKTIRRALTGGLILLGATAQDTSPARAAPPRRPSFTVQYRAIKKVAFAFDVDVEGRCSAIDARLRRVAPGQVSVAVSLDVARCDSGNSKRDRHVADLLGEVRLSSEPVDATRLWNARRKGRLTIPGALTVAKATRPVELHVDVRDGLLFARFEMKLSEHDLEAPRLGPLGVGGRVEDEIQIEVRGPVVALAGWADLPASLEAS